MFRCNSCDKSYQRKTHLVRHEATHSQQQGSACPFCKKSFQKIEVTRRHIKSCAKKHDQPLPPAAKPGRKRQSCDACFFAKAACDKRFPCSRCTSLSKECTYAVFPSQTPPAASRAPKVPASLSVAASQTAQNGDNLFLFLGHFTSPSVKRDRLAIGETAKSSAPRNLESIHSHLEEALVPTTPMPAFLEDERPTEISFPLLNSIDESLFSQLPPEDLFPSKLSTQLTELVTELVETSKSMDIDDAENQRPLDIMDLTALFGVSNISAFVSAFFRSLHWHLPVVHFPTFDPGNISNPLLLAIFLSGATYAGPFDGATLSPWIFDVAEEYIFRKVLNLSTATSSKDSAHLPTIQLIQGALIMEMLQFSRDDIQTRRRIRVMRHPCLVSTVRSLGIFQLKRSPAPHSSDEIQWRTLVAEEVRIRIACWVFLADGFLTVCFKNHPAISIFEMDCPLPWSPEMWEAENCETFGNITSKQVIPTPQPPLKDAVSQLLEKPEPEPPVAWSLSLSPEDLLILIYAIHSLAFQVRTGLLKFLPRDAISRGARNWKQIWDSVINSITQKHGLHLGYPKHAEELWQLLTATLEIPSGYDVNLAYLDGKATDELGSLNEFIQWCYQKAT